MRIAALLLALTATPALAQAPDPAPVPTAARAPVPHVCIPTAVLERLVAYQSRQPWADVAQTMAALQSLGPNLPSCTVPAPEAPALAMPGPGR